MEMTNIIALLLFILPGILAEKISYIMDFPSAERRSEFKEIVNGLLYSLPIVILTSLVFWKKYQLASLNCFIEKLDDLSFLFKFSLCIFGFAITLGFLKGLTDRHRIIFVNWIRNLKIFGNKMPIDDKTCYRKFFLDINESKFLEVIQDGVSYKGFANGYSLLNEEKAVALKIYDVLYKYPDFDIDKLFTKVLGTYIDIEKNVVIKDYDMTTYNAWCESKKK